MTNLTGVSGNLPRSAPQFRASATASATAPASGLVNIAIPATAQVGDFLIVYFNDGGYIIDHPNPSGYKSTTSTTSLNTSTLGTLPTPNQQIFAVNSVGSYLVGDYVNIYNPANPNTAMRGTITNISSLNITVSGLSCYWTGGTLNVAYTNWKFDLISKSDWGRYGNSVANGITCIYVTTVTAGMLGSSMDIAISSTTTTGVVTWYVGQIILAVFTNPNKTGITTTVISDGLYQVPGNWRNSTNSLSIPWQSITTNTWTPTMSNQTYPPNVTKIIFGTMWYSSGTAIIGGTITGTGTFITNSHTTYSTIVAGLGYVYDSTGNESITLTSNSTLSDMAITQLYLV